MDIPVIPEGTDPPLDYVFPLRTWCTVGRIGDTAIKVMVSLNAEANVGLSVHATNLAEPIATDFLTHIQRATSNAEYDKLVDELTQYTPDQLRRLSVAVHDADYLVDMAMERHLGATPDNTIDFTQPPADAFNQRMRQLTEQAQTRGQVYADASTQVDFAFDTNNVEAEAAADEQPETTYQENH